MRKATIHCIYNKVFFESILKFMLDENIDSAVDISDTFWHREDVENVLVKEYGYRKCASGKLL